MSGAIVDFVKPDKPSGILIYRRRFPKELVPFIPRADGRGMGRRELRVSLLAKNMDDPGVSDRWLGAKADYDRIVAKAEKAAAASHKRATGSFDTLSAPEIAYLAGANRQERLENDDKARWNPEERSLFQSVAAQLSTTGAGAAAPWVGREGSPGVRKEWRRYIEIFTEFLGHGDALRVTRDDVAAWRDHLIKTPGRSGKQRKPVTVRDKYLTALKGTLNWAVEERFVHVNVAAEVAVRVPKSVKLRSPDYTMDEARSILRATLVPASSRMPATTARARRWVPWLCAYSGPRVGELAQLRKQDIAKHDGVWMMNVTPDAGSVKTREARLVPIHDHVIEQGFLEEVQKLPSGPIFYDPENRRSPDDDEANRHSKKVGQRLADWVRKEVGITDTAIKPNHAWRHLFATLAEEAGIPERTYNAIQGHAPANTARRYGSTTAKAKAEAIKKFPRFDVDV